ncbi:GGDEF family protein [Vibrio ichthyoenteri ATCC 700023]|uniref:GGDEF family protein n=1 Tax=Vibrio ichthyoenteri ATCC 700023 TaxID=870968 RepID=F9RYR1_9VIBR|nr:GGDEF domain-containing protein [Vibrio ichthyoenteri]EGU46337.1 GGDEF family protein [Vibrio ichthyoenteri ATCC 700023]
MSNFVGRHLEEMADIRATRKCKLVRLCSLLSICVLSGYSLAYLTHSEKVFAIVNFISCIILALNLWHLHHHRSLNYSDLILTAVLMFQGIMLLLYSERFPDRLMWIFPIIAAIILINEFKVGLLFSGVFCALAIAASLFTDAIGTQAHSPQERFILSLVVICLICNTASFYYSKMLNYIQSLYREGIEDLAYLDQLTGLANRWSFEHWAKKKLAEITHLPSTTALVFLDIDDFKEINDTYGHEVGDRVLQQFSKRLKNNIRTRDRENNKHDYSIARFAGDEFVILLYDVRSKQDLEGILDRICHLFQDSYAGSKQISSLTVSVGVALYPQDADNLHELTRCADKAMYAAKHGGKNQFQYYHGDRYCSLKDIPSLNKDNIRKIKKA